MTAGRIETDLAVPPGEFLVEELAARGISQRELARRTGRPLPTINAIALGRKSITARTALDLERVLEGIPADFWLNLQTRYDLTLARGEAARAAG
jgi:HTH-type transcriptional regulator/antitoxin HigA